MKNSVVLLGDSTIDNKAYVHVDEPDVISQLKTTAKQYGLKLKSFARDGDTINGIMRTLENSELRRDVSNSLFTLVSIGGNDALGVSGIFNAQVKSFEQAFAGFFKVRVDFEREYKEMLTILRKLNPNIIICTIYYPRYDTSSKFYKAAMTALPTFNDVIFKLGAKYHTDILDLRVALNKDKHFANPIEPSFKGGKKFSNAFEKAIIKYKSFSQEDLSTTPIHIYT